MDDAGSSLFTFFFFISQNLQSQISNEFYPIPSIVIPQCDIIIFAPVADYFANLVRIAALLFIISWPKVLQRRIVLYVKGFQHCILGFRRSGQDGIRKANAMELAMISLVKACSSSDFGAHGDNTEEGDKVIYGSLLRISLHSSIQFRNNYRREDDARTVGFNEGHCLPVTPKKINENIRI